MDHLIYFFNCYGYFAVFFILLICGFGVPIPEDITLVSGGVISGLGSANVHWMLVVSMVGVLIGDSTMYWLGRIYGEKILKFPLIRRIATPERFLTVQNRFERQGWKLLFIARFLPGLRAVVYLTSGITNKVSFIRFIFVDFCAAIISVPIWVYLGYFGAKNLDKLHSQIHKGQMIMWGILIVGGLFALWKWKKSRQKKNSL
ncbi:DedA family protein [Otariodibacter oris]|uniref:Membrane protein DedA with SNARE-associated domain n=1 Tax=Otariodibacter oris TaxID=1032623 RepID=A0A420XIV1_9PAST|nr:DedA family protein [Otariodibacter oris]QGM80602.1 alpha-amylase [Otariodibacter oris]RKR77242.1 membrane protein DedA with SNARE-associated domain [Otariodibacter oris]